MPAGTCFENEVRQIDACFRPASLMATAPTNSSDSWEVRHVPGVDDASVPCPLISRCEEHSAHICCRHAFLPPSSLLPPSSFLLSRTDFFEGTGERAWSSPIAALRDPTCMFTLPSFTEQFPLPPPFSTRQGASRPGIDSIASHTRQGSPSFSLGREGWLARVAGALYEGRQREEGPELRSCGVLLLSLRGTSPNIASLSEVRHVGLTGTWGLFDKAAACGLDHGFSQPCATLHSNVHMSFHV